jgi:hypothetical protein
LPQGEIFEILRILCSSSVPFCNNLLLLSL